MKKNTGITLIALIVTIIVLLILAGIVLNFALGELGILNTSKEAIEKHNLEAAREMVALEMTNFKIEWFGKTQQYPHMKELRDEYTPSNDVDYLLFLYDRVAAIKDNYFLDSDAFNQGSLEKIPKYALIKMKQYAYEFTLDDDLNIVEVEKIGGNGENGGNQEEPDFPYEDDTMSEVPEGWIGIYTLEDLKNVANNLSGNYIVMADLNLSSISNWTPIGNQQQPFSGMFNGNGYTIRNMKINTNNNKMDYLGLFGYTQNSSKIYNFSLTDYTITASGEYIGAVVGYNQGSISKIDTKGSITLNESSNCVGGIAGYHGNKTSQRIETISQVYTEGTIGSNTNYGTRVGGIVGYVQGADVSKSESTKIIDSYTSAVVKAKEQVGGIIGSIQNAHINTSYAIGKVSGEAQVGGAVGFSSGAVASNVYWVKETTGQNSSALGIHTTLLQLIQKSSYTGFDFANRWNIEEGKSLAYLQNMPIPDIVYDIVKGYHEMQGNGTESSPYLIWTKEQLNMVRNEPNAYYKVMADIDLSSISKWTPIGTEEEPFNGNFNGNGFTIRNMQINSTDNFSGLFGFTGSSSNIYDFSLDNYNIYAGGEYIGAVVGYNQGNISKINTKGAIRLRSTSYYIGGIAGMHDNTVNATRSISQVYTEGEIGNISYGDYVGGIIGFMQGTTPTSSLRTSLENAYTTATVKGRDTVGGMVACIENACIRNSYAIGNVQGTVSVGGAVGVARNTSGCYNAYWVNETTGQNTSAVGINATISQLAQKSGYTGFDFASIWSIEEGKSLAYLQGMPVPDAVYDMLKGYGYMEGIGTSSSPYLITTAQQLNKVRYQLGAYYKVMADIDLSSISNWIPIGTDEEPFTGNFNGNGYTIRNMQINSTNNFLGLFGATGSSSEIYDFSLDNYYIYAGCEYIGAVVGYNQGNISKINTKGSIRLRSESYHIGGIAGMHDNTATYSRSISQVYTEGEIGNINYGGYVGGIIGFMQGTTPTSNLRTSLENAYTTATVKGRDTVGGMVGYIDNACIRNAYATGNVQGTVSVGGAVGIARNAPTCYNTYWVNETTGQNTSAVGINATISQLAQKSGYTGFDFAGIWSIEEGQSLAYLQGMPVPDAIYDMLKGYGYMEGIGTSSSPYLITTAQQLNKVRYQLGAYYKVMADIDLSSISNWIPIGTEEEPFTGNFDGNGHTIRNMQINSTNDFLGLFGFTGSSSNIYNFSLDNYYIYAGCQYIGAVVGYNMGNISKINTKGSIRLKSTSYHIGGIAGVHDNTVTNSRTISQVYTEGEIGHSTYGISVGGIVGYMRGTTPTSNLRTLVENAYSLANVKAKDTAAGIVGYMENAYIRYSYAAGKVIGSVKAGGAVGAVGNSAGGGTVYWDTETTEQSESRLGTGKTTQEMKQQSTYSGFDFTNIWKIEADHYPVFQ